MSAQPAPRPRACDVCGYERYDLAWSMRPGRCCGYWLCLACREDDTKRGGFSTCELCGQCDDRLQTVRCVERGTDQRCLINATARTALGADLSEQRNQRRIDRAMQDGQL